jgi:diaminopimelate epimerase
VRLDFVKMHGLGNDFLVFDQGPAGPPSAATLRRLADRHTGIGFDQALVLAPARSPGAAARYRVFNADGDEVEQCGNGARCVAALLAQRTGVERGEMVLESTAGPVMARLLGAGRVSVAMGVPDFRPSSLPFVADREAQRYALATPAGDLEIGAVAIGNPHAVLIVPRTDAAAVDSLGPTVENHPRFPGRTNVEFMEVVDPGHIRLRVHERGVGETRACGTGACGAVAVGRQLGLLGPKVMVDLPGGTLEVEWAGPGTTVWLTGPTATAFEGHTEI